MEAKRLRDLRALLNLSQREMAVQFGVAHGAIALWENGKRTIPGPVLRLMDIYEENLGMVNQPNDSGNGLKKLNSSWVSRTLRTSTTAAKLGARMATSSLQQLVVGQEKAQAIKTATQIAIAEDITQSLGELKGLLMKMGQIMSYMDFALPEQARHILSSLQDHTQPMAPEVVNRIIMRELGNTPDRIFKKWSAKPIAAASIGQVHRAELKDGTQVVVKVQYPEITKTLESDLANTALFDRLGSIMFRGQDKGSLLQELRERLLEECDYENEANNLRFFKKAYADVEWVVIPDVFGDYSTKHVLTMEYIEGQRYSEFLKTASQAEKNKAGERMFEMMFTSIFKHRVFNCDPHPGNYLFLKDKVAFLDFGCVKRFDGKFLTLWKNYARSVLERDRKSADKNLMRLDFVPRPEKFDFDYQDRMIVSLYEPWMTEAAYKFTRNLASNTWKLMMVDNPNKFYANVPKDWVFVNRLQWGLYSVLAEMGAEFDARSIALSLLYDADEKWPAPLFKHQ